MKKKPYIKIKELYLQEVKYFISKNEISNNLIQLINTGCLNTIGLKYSQLTFDEMKLFLKVNIKNLMIYDCNFEILIEVT